MSTLPNGHAAVSMAAPDEAPAKRSWTLITNHGACLIYVAEHPNATIREIADAIGVTERAAARILRELRDAEYLIAHRVGRRNGYELNASLPMRHPVSGAKQVQDLLRGLAEISR